MEPNVGDYHMKLIEDNDNIVSNLEYAFNMAQNVTQSESSPDLTQSKKNQRGNNFSPEEDKLMISGWLNTSQDPIHGSDQKKSSFWARVEDYFNENKDFISRRNANSLMHRWSVIQKGVNKFAGCFAQIEGLNQSGTTDDDKVANAKLMYKRLHKTYFPFEHCWKLLRYEQKWLERVTPPKKPVQEGTATPTQVNLEDDANVPVVTNGFERPIGRKAAKKQKFNRKSNEHQEEHIDVMISDIRVAKLASASHKKEIYEKSIEIEKIKAEKLIEIEKLRVDSMIEIEKEKIRVDEQKVRVKQQQEDNKILMMDTSTLPPAIKAYYERRIKEILEREQRE